MMLVALRGSSSNILDVRREGSELSIVCKRGYLGDKAHSSFHLGNIFVRLCALRAAVLAGRCLRRMWGRDSVGERIHSAADFA